MDFVLIYTFKLSYYRRHTGHTQTSIESTQNI